MKLIHRFILFGVLFVSPGIYGQVQSQFFVDINALAQLPHAVASGTTDTIFVSVYKADTSTTSADTISFGYSINGVTDSVPDPNSISYTPVSVNSSFKLGHEF